MLTQGQQIKVTGPHDYTLHETEFKEASILAQVEIKNDPEALATFSRKSTEGGIICTIEKAKDNDYISSLCKMPLTADLPQTLDALKKTPNKNQSHALRSDPHPKRLGHQDGRR